MSYEQSPMSKILETIADRLVDMHLSNNRRFDELAAQLEALLPAKAGEQLSLLAIVTAPEAVVPNEDEAMPVVEPVIVQNAPSPRKRSKATSWSKMDAQACAFAKAYTQARNEMMQYKVKLDNESLAPSVRAHLQTKYETKRLEQAAHKSEYNKRVAVLQASLTT